MFGFLSESTTVSEDTERVEICVVLLSSVIFLTPINLFILFEDGQGELNYILHCEN